MPIERDELESLLGECFTNADIKIEDLAGDNDHWQVTVASSVFEGKSLIEQHRMVQDAVRNNNIHALSIKTLLK